MNKTTMNLKGFYPFTKVKNIFLFFIVLQTQAQAMNTINFTGTWQLDLKASDSIDSLLKAQGKSRFERRIANSMEVTQNISHQQNSISIKMSSRAVDETHVFVLNKQWHPLNTARMGTISAQSYYAEGNHGAIITEMKIQANGKPALLSSTRTLSQDGNSMFLDLLLRLHDGSQYSSRRVFTRL